MSSTATAEPKHEKETLCLAALVIGIGIYQFARTLLSGMEGAFTILLIFVAIAAFAFVPATIARAKGHSETGFYLFGTVFWLPALIVALLLGDRRSAS